MKKCIMCMIAMSVLSVQANAADYAELMERYRSNRAKMTSLLCIGSVSVSATAPSGGSAAFRSQGELRVYVKAPGMMKVAVEKPEHEVLVLKGNILSRKTGGVVVSGAADANGDIIGKYLGYDADDLADADVVSQGAVTEQGRDLYRVVLGSAATSAGAGKAGRRELYFDGNGMIVRRSVFSNDAEVSRTDIAYARQEGIFVPVEITTVIRAGNACVTTALKYSIIKVNIALQDGEFEL